MIPKHIQERLNELAKATAEILYSNTREMLSKEPYINTGELADSLRISIIPSRNDSPPEIVLEYADQGYYIGYKSPKWTKVPNLDKLRAWAEQVDLSGPVPGYKNGAPNLPPWKAKERRIAAIAWSKRKFDTWKAKPWKGKKGIDLGKILREMNSQTLEAWARVVETALVEGIESGTGEGILS